MQFVSSLVAWTSRALLVVAAVLGFLISFLVVADVTGRVLFNSPVKGTPELVSMSIVIICFLQAGYAIRSGGMLNVDFLLVKLPPAARSLAISAGALLGAALFALICWGSFEPALHAWQSNEFEGEGALHVPAWPARWIIVAGTALAALSYVLIAIENLVAGLAGRGPSQTFDASH